ncbi:MAG: RNA-binding protein [Candidatus Woesearchaeota archaeon]
MKHSFKNHVTRAITQNLRYDGRKADQYRTVSVETGVSKNAEGSAKVTFGNSTVIAGVKLSTATPYADAADQGMLMVDVQLLPLSNPSYDVGPPGVEAIELSRVVDRGVRESHCIDMKKLCIQEGEKVWMVSLDVCTLNADGNILDLASLAVMAALKDARFPTYDEKTQQIDYKNPSKEKMPLVKQPIAVTVYKIKDQLYVDPTEAEEVAADSRLTITTIEDGTIVAMQKGGSGTLSLEDVGAMVDLATKSAQDLRKHL